jgi:uncharacterized peroxidase-related enzyme
MNGLMQDVPLTLQMVLRDSIRLYQTVMFGPSPLTRAQREMLAVVVSRANDCEYWVRAHLHDLRSEVADKDLADRFAADWRSAGLDEPTQALLGYADRLTRTPAACGLADVRALRDAGWDDRAITDACQVIAYFNYINRIADAIGVDPEPDWR